MGWVKKSLTILGVALISSAVLGFFLDGCLGTDKTETGHIRDIAYHPPYTSLDPVSHVEGKHTYITYQPHFHPERWEVFLTSPSCGTTYRLYYSRPNFFNGESITVVARIGKWTHGCSWIQSFTKSTW